MTKDMGETALDWETLRLGIERCDAELLIDFYAEDARLSIINADAPHASRFVLGGRAEIAKHLRVTFGPETFHRVEREAVIGGDRVKFREASEYPDGGRVLVETTLEVHGGKIVSQVDVVTNEVRADAAPPDDLLRFKQTDGKEDLR